MNYFLWEEKMKTREDRRKWSKLNSYSHILEKPAHSFFGAWSFLLVHLWFTPSEGLKGFIN